MEDPLLEPYRGGLVEWLVRCVPARSDVGQLLRRAWIRFAQRRTEGMHSKVRRQLLQADRQAKTILSFTGQPE